MRFRWGQTVVAINWEWTWSFYVHEQPGFHMSAFGPLHIAVIR